MLKNLLVRFYRPPSPRLAQAYEAACQRLLTGLTNVVRKWEMQPIQRRKWQFVGCLMGLLLLSSLSVYVTATGHFFTRITHKHYEQSANVESLRRK